MVWRTVNSNIKQDRLLSSSRDIELSLIIYRHNNLMACILRKNKDICSSFSGRQRSNKPSSKYSSRRGNRHSTQAIFLHFSREIILKRTVYNNGICELLPDIMEKKDTKASLSHITNMEEMNKSNELITYLSSNWPLRVFMPFMTSHCISLWEE